MFAPPLRQRADIDEARRSVLPAPCAAFSQDRLGGAYPRGSVRVGTAEIMVSYIGIRSSGDARLR